MSARAARSASTGLAHVIWPGRTWTWSTRPTTSDEPRSLTSWPSSAATWTSNAGTATHFVKRLRQEPPCGGHGEMSDEQDEPPFSNRAPVEHDCRVGDRLGGRGCRHDIPVDAEVL